MEELERRLRELETTVAVQAQVMVGMQKEIEEVADAQKNLALRLWGFAGLVLAWALNQLLGLIPGRGP